MRSPLPRFVVDDAALDAALAALGDAGSAMTEVRVQLRTVFAAAPRWAADGDLPDSVRELVDDLDAAARRGQIDAIALSEALRTAAREYLDVERRATAPS